MKCPCCKVDLSDCDNCGKLFELLNEVKYQNFNEKTQKWAYRTHKTYLCDECLKLWEEEYEKH